MIRPLWRKIITGITLGSVLLPLFASAARDIPLDVSIKILGRERFTDMADYIGVVYQYLTGIAGVFAVVMIMYGGMKWIFAAGDAGKISAAKETITHAVIGLLLALGSFLMLNTINPNLVKLKVPEIKVVPNVPLAAAGFCPSTGDFQGKLPCGTIYSLKQGVPGEIAPPGLIKAVTDLNPGQTQCFGSSCQGQESCWYSTQVAPNDKRAPYTCVNLTKCANTCVGISDQALCDSEGCIQFTKQRCWWRNNKCEPRIATGAACDAEAKLPACGNNICPDSTCADLDSVCDAAGKNACKKVRMVAKGGACTNGAVCQSGKCAGGASKLGIAGSFAAGAVGTGVVLGYTGAGAALGSVVPGLGTAVGLVGGAAVGVGYYIYATYVTNGTCQ